MERIPSRISCLMHSRVRDEKPTKRIVDWDSCVYGVMERRNRDIGLQSPKEDTAIVGWHAECDLKRNDEERVYRAGCLMEEKKRADVRIELTSTKDS